MVFDCNHVSHSGTFMDADGRCKNSLFSTTLAIKRDIKCEQNTQHMVL